MAEPFSKERQLARGERRYRRKVASPKQWQAIRADLYAENCFVCDGVLYYGEIMEAHHLVPRSMGGDDVLPNLVGLHRSCHKLVTERDAVSLAALAASLTDSRYAYVVGKLGEGAMQRLFGV